MKRVLRSCFEPLPRFMSTKSLVGLVLMLLAGTGLSVYEYLESSRPPERHPVERHPVRVEKSPAAGEVQAAERDLVRPARVVPLSEAIPPTTGSASHARPEIGPAARSAAEWRTSPPSVWDPIDAQVGG